MSESPPVARRPERRRNNLTRGAFHAHLWLGILFTVILTAISITGILLNHKRGLGLMPDVAHAPTGAFEHALPLAQLGEIALRAVRPDVPPDFASIDRMDVRPRDGFVKVRLRDSASTEATVDLTSGSVLHIGPRGDAFLEKLHSGEIFGSRGVLLSDAGAVALVITLITGVWLWLAPKLRRGPAAKGGEP
ncbi:MAG TPA: PepSY-associated TM helix domain-containing protein [Gemmatimonadaceae bacterium]|nr:PepSY-associated TM helix domain-containing protein [Gemmatimonadaceae bacterium]